ncbi:Gfo/Idh/MocA family protein [Streptomyces benahoarensis]|uniref:Gfo/Idh/MocA family oxidoreductase n=1 Tax=Streptomyces benahoarensis TaxID=2595054 RepID=A0A553ZA51_9ACTN|nr:Gfo/Idh/MocA family oxidoreductase [Streptomyces benahoarensis]TSB20118.1 Gfo/Idh/MocA family oxidoreductase [Streptomyces benahoarensis]TSB38311.1 Gfo/Idh/MocA family oxidoreductase [Streptomyces benahoarensis]
MTPLRIGIIGLGVISRFYLAALDRSPEADLVAVCDPDTSTHRDLPSHVARHTGHRELLATADVDAVVVNVPNDLHFPVCRDALAAGRSVCVEKPLANSVEDARQLVALARGTGAVLFTSFHRRYNAEVLALRDRLPRGVPVASLTVRYEEMIEEHAGRDRWYLDPARCGGGCLADNGPNALDVARLLLGDVRVTGADLRLDAHGVDRSAQILLDTPAGTAVRIVLDWSYPGERKTVEVQLADGRTDGADMLAGHPEFKGSLWHEYEGVLREFARSVRAGATGGPTAPDGLATAELVADAYAHGARQEARS